MLSALKTPDTLLHAEELVGPERAPGAAPRLRVLPAKAALTGVVLVIHGGKNQSLEPTAWEGLAVRRLSAATGALHTLLGPEVAVAQLRLAIQGWNEGGKEARADVTWALEALAAQFPGAPVVIVAHSLGGRAALYIAQDPATDAVQLRGVVALAPWLPPQDQQLRAENLRVPVHLVHALGDLWVPYRWSRVWAGRAEHAPVTFSTLVGTGHSMVRRAGRWHLLAARHARLMLAA